VSDSASPTDFSPLLRSKDKEKLIAAG